MNTIVFFFFSFFVQKKIAFKKKMIASLCDDVFNQNLSFVSLSDITSVLKANKKLSTTTTLSGSLEDKEIEIYGGFRVLLFCRWIERYCVRKIKRLEIRNVNLRRYPEIKETDKKDLDALQDLRVKTLVLAKIIFGDIDYLIPKHVENLYIDKCLFPVMMSRINEVKSLKTLSLYGQTGDVSDMKEIGLKNLSVKQLSTNYLRSMPEMIEFLENSLRNENMNEFSFEMPIEDRRTNEPLIEKKIKDVYPKTKIVEKIGTTRFYW